MKTSIQTYYAKLSFPLKKLFECVNLIKGKMHCRFNLCWDLDFLKEMFGISSVEHSIFKLPNIPK